MPAVKTSHRHTVIVVIEIVNQLIVRRIIWISQIRCTIILFHRLTIYLFRKAPGTTEIIFCSRSANSWIFLISVNIEFNFAFTPPVTFQCCQCHISTYIVTLSFDIIKNYIIFLQLGDLFSSPLCMEVSDILRQSFIIQAVIHLIEECRNWIGMLIFQSDSCFFSERHLEITIQSSAWHYRDRHRIYITFSTKTTTEKVSQRTFYRRFLFIIPVHTKNQISQYKAICVCGFCIHGNPDMVDRTRSFNLCQCHCLTTCDISKTRASFSGRSEITGCHTAFSFFSSWIFRIDRTAFSVFRQCKIA